MVRGDSQTKRTSFTEKLEAMVGMKPREKEEVTTTTEKGRIFCAVSSINTEADQGKEQTVEGAVGHQYGQAAETKLPLVELGELMSKLEQINETLRCSKENSQQLRKELRHNKNEYPDNSFVLARITEEKLQQMADKVETTDKEREKHIKTDMEEMKKRYETVNDKLWNLQTRMDTMSKEQAANLCAI